MKKLLIYCLCCLFLYTAQAQDNSALQRYTAWNEVIQKAQKENKLIFVDVYFTGCFPCAQMDKEVFPNELVQAILKENFVSMKTDILVEAVGDSLVKKYRISGFPTYLLLSSDGDLINSISGYADVSVLMGIIKKALELNKSKTYLTGFSRSLQVNYPQQYLDFYSKERKPLDPAVANEWISKNRSTNREAADMLFLLNRNADPVLEDAFLKNYNAYREMYGQELILSKAQSVLATKVRELIKERNDALFLQTLNSYRSMFKYDDDWKIFKLLMASDYFGGFVKDKEAFIRFMAENPVMYKNYFGANANEIMYGKNKLEKAIPYLAKWGAGAIDENTSIDLIIAVANVYKNLNDSDHYKKYMEMAIAKAKMFKMDTEKYSAMLKNN